MAFFSFDMHIKMAKKIPLFPKKIIANFRKNILTVRRKCDIMECAHCGAIYLIVYYYLLIIAHFS